MTDHSYLNDVEGVGPGDLARVIGVTEADIRDVSLDFMSLTYCVRTWNRRRFNVIAELIT